MSLKYRPMAIMGFSSLSVLFLCTYFDDRFSFVSIGAGIIILLLTVFIRRLRERVTPFFIAAALIFSGVSFEALSDYKISYADSLTDRESVVDATVLDEPEFINSKYYYILKTNSIDGEKFSVKLRLSASQYIEAEPYDNIKLKVKLYEIGSFSRDIKLYYRSKSIFLGGYVGNYDDFPIEISKPDTKPLSYKILKIRKTVESRILDKLPNDCGGVTVGMLTGNKDYISDEAIADIRSAGVAPVFAVSGMHLSVWIIGLYMMLELFGVKKRTNSLIGIAFSLFFMAVTGFSPSVCRAGIMFLLILSGNLFRRKADSLNSLGFAALLLGIINPMIVADIGFLLSFSSTFGIILLNPWFRTHVEPKLNGILFERILKFIAESVFVSLSATVGSIGFIIVFIGYVSIYSVVANLLITYIASLCMLCGGFTALMYFFPGVGNAFAVITGCLAKYIIGVIEKIAELPFATVDTTNEYWTYGVIAFYALVLCSYIIFKNKTAFKISCAGLALTVLCCCLLYHFNYADCTFIRVVDTDDSIAVLISRNGGSALICSESNNKYFSSAVTSAAEDNGGKRLKLIISDVDGGNMSGLLSVIKDSVPDELIVPKSNDFLKELMNDRKIVQSSNSKIMLWKNAETEFVSNSNCCIAYCTVQGVEVCIILRSEDYTRISERYLKGDIVVSAEPFENTAFIDSVIVGDDADGFALSTGKYGNIDIKIKDNSYKFIIEEG